MKTQVRKLILSMVILAAAGASLQAKEITLSLRTGE